MSDAANHLTPHRWKPGVSGNPSGKPKGVRAFRRAIARGTRSGKALIELALQIASDAEASDRDRLDAAKFLAAYLYGKPVAPSEVELTARAERPMPPWAQAEMAAYAPAQLEAARKALRSPPADAADVEPAAEPAPSEARRGR